MARDGSKSGGRPTDAQRAIMRLMTSSQESTAARRRAANLIDETADRLINSAAEMSARLKEHCAKMEPSNAQKLVVSIKGALETVSVALALAKELRPRELQRSPRADFDSFPEPPEPPDVSGATSSG